jgi:hypothetical protein
MDKEQLAWQRKIIREEYVNDSKQLFHDATVSTKQTLSKRRSKGIKRMETPVGR